MDLVRQRWRRTVKAELQARSMSQRRLASLLGLHENLLSDMLAGRKGLTVDALVGSLLVLGPTIAAAWPTPENAVPENVLLLAGGWQVGDGTLPELAPPTADRLLAAGLLELIADNLTGRAIPPYLRGSWAVLDGLLWALTSAGVPFEQMRLIDPEVAPFLRVEYPDPWVATCMLVTTDAISTPTRARSTVETVLGRLSELRTSDVRDRRFLLADVDSAADRLPPPLHGLRSVSHDAECLREGLRLRAFSEILLSELGHGGDGADAPF